ncbi:MAG: ABC-F family ATP-binding cassette domain-containing protein [Solobacterium sp.]|nr:ABC-F family ATP-binding cassette domain-containing protein [Solobacterium sp.]
MLKIQNLSITYRRDSRVLVDHFNLVLGSLDKAVLIGEEGNGKSTLLKWIHDPSLIEEYADAEGICVREKEKTGWLPQQLPEEDKDKTIYEYFLEEPLFTECGPKELGELAASIHIPNDIFYSDQIMKTLSGGEKVKVQMARILLSRPTVLLLDEPSNDLDIETLEWLEELIINCRQAVLFISHDEVLISHAANRIIHIELLHRKTQSRITQAAMNYEDYMEQRNDLFDKQMQKAVWDRRADAERMERFRRIQQKVNHDLNNVSRQDPHSGRLLKKKMHAVKSLGRRFERERENMTEIPEQEEAIGFSFSEKCSVPYGKKVMDFHLDELRAPDGRLLSKDISLEIYGPAHICITGANGCGKTTLLKIIAEELLARDDIKAAYMPQNYEDLLDLDITPVEFLAPEKDKESVTKARQYLGAMRYTTNEMEHAIRDLSGGQKAKVLLLKMNLDEADVLLLDEPTRNFSPLSSPVIRKMIAEFGGCVISVSHDRMFIQETARTVCVLDENGLHRTESS